MARDKRKSQQADRRRVVKKKVSILSSENIDWVDYKDVNLLRRFMSERAKIRARRVTGNSAQQQRAVARAIRIAREMALLPYSVRQVTQRGRGGRRDRERDRPLEAVPELEGVEREAAPPEAGVERESEPDGLVEADTQAAAAEEADTSADGETQP
jgi:small subunit ribosomal protein S18